MPAQHRIDNHNKVIITTWSGEATDRALFDAMTKYLQDIKNQPEYHSYSEIADFSKTSVFHVSDSGITKIARLMADNDAEGGKTKLAIVINVPPEYDLGRMYEIYRSVSAANRIVRVFSSHAEAFEWVIGNVS